MAVENMESADADATADVNAGTDTGSGTDTGTDTDIGTMAAQRYPVAPGYRVNVRSGPSTQYRLVRVLPYEANVPIRCQRPGQNVSGPYGTSKIWDNIAPGEYISDAYVKTGADGYIAPRCS